MKAGNVNYSLRPGNVHWFFCETNLVILKQQQIGPSPFVFLCPSPRVASGRRRGIPLPCSGARSAPATTCRRPLPPPGACLRRPSSRPRRRVGLQSEDQPAPRHAIPPPGRRPPDRPATASPPTGETAPPTSSAHLRLLRRANLRRTEVSCLAAHLRLLRQGDHLDGHLLLVALLASPAGSSRPRQLQPPLPTSVAAPLSADFGRQCLADLPRLPGSETTYRPLQLLPLPPAQSSPHPAPAVGYC